MNRVIERILNLLAFLLTVGRPVSAEEIRFTVAGYDQETDEAFRRTFERDKDLLRTVGVPLRMDHTDAWEVEQGYVVSPEEYALEDPGLTDTERAALWLATRMVRLGGQAPGPAALFKLGGAPGAATGEPLTADLGAETEVLALLFAAISERRTLSFGYRDSQRTVEPLGLVHRMGHWYLVARTGGEQRSFRVDRMSRATAGERPGAFRRPKGFDAATAMPEKAWEAGEDDLEATVRFDSEIAWWARRQLTSRATVTEHDDGAVTAVIPVASVEAFIGWMIGFEDRAEIVGPAEIRSRLVARVRGAS
jgi:predicted DNA-binding transcriptional regulator YafY